jgi:hypothetical protein
VCGGEQSSDALQLRRIAAVGGARPSIGVVGVVSAVCLIATGGFSCARGRETSEKDDRDALQTCGGRGNDSNN